MISVYEIINIENGRSYVGSSTDIKRRWGAHVRSLRKGTHRNSHLQRAWDKYGEGAFSFCVLEVMDKEDDLTSREQYYLDMAFECCDPYNTAASAQNLTLQQLGRLKRAMVGRKLSDEHIEILRRANTGRKNSSASRQKMSQSAKGRTKSEEHKRKLSEALAGRKLSGELCRKLSAIRKERGIVPSKKCIDAARAALSKPYPAFIHMETGEIIPAGYNLSELCRGMGLGQGSMSAVKNGRRHYHKGWMLLKDGNEG